MERVHSKAERRVHNIRVIIEVVNLPFLRIVVVQCVRLMLCGLH